MKGTEKPKTIVLTGITGFIGQTLSEFLSGRGYRVLGLSRNPETFSKTSKTGTQIFRWDPVNLDGWEQILKKADILINLAGENISAFRWTSKKKKRILNSRIQATKILVQALKQSEVRPDLFIQVSGIHFYGFQSETIMEESAPAGHGFLSEVARTVEALSEGIKSKNIRRILVRLGPVWSNRGGILPRLIRPFKWFAGGRFGNGRQRMSWIHDQDFCQALDFLISRPDFSGPVNLTSPQPAENREMAGILGKILKRPALFNIPGWVIKILLGEMGEELLLSDQQVYPKYLLDSGFEFKFPGPQKALYDLLTKS
jgi:uncharacterized protein (TIGR01777 family)